ncbi:MAG: sigma 54-interacting transcriptional regulator [Bradymonadia bacterium]
MSSQHKATETQETIEHYDSLVEQMTPEGPSVGHLRVVHRADGVDEGVAFTLRYGEYVLGRSSGHSLEHQTIVLPDRGISRKHLHINRRLSGTTIRDLESRNGSFLNGRPVPKQWVSLRDGDVIRVGDSLLIYRDSDPHEGPWSDPFLPGHAPKIVYARKRIHQIARHRVPLLILGETGTGKEFAARAVHEMAGKPGGAFVPVNCGELTRGVSRAELFGREAGAYTDAKTRQHGLVTQAHQGTLFLDEIGDLDAEVQVELIRFLQDGGYRRVGGEGQLHADVRVVAATNVPLEQAVADGQFRQDLLARLRAPVAPVRLPPLRERREDILSWARTFIHEEAQRFELQAPRWNAGFAECLLIHNWSDNLRGLRMAIGTALLECEGAYTLEAKHLSEELSSGRRTARRNPLHSRVPMVSVPPSVGKPDADTVIAVLKETQGVMKAAAAVMGIDRRKLYRLCEEYDIDYGGYRGDPEVMTQHPSGEFHESQT